MKKTPLWLAAALFFVTIGGGCSENHPTPTEDVIPNFEYKVDNRTVIFTNTTVVKSGNYSSLTYLWSFDFGDQGSFQRNPVQLYPAPGTYTVRLTATQCMVLPYYVNKQVVIP